jgi:hypothetical protein
MPIPLLLKEAAFIAGRSALVAGLTALGAFLLQKGTAAAEQRGVKIPLAFKETRKAVIEIKK